MQRAMDVLKLTADERKDVEEYFKSKIIGDMNFISPIFF